MNSSITVPKSGDSSARTLRRVLVHAQIPTKDPEEVYPDDWESTGIYEALVPAALSDSLAAACAMGAYHRQIPIKWLFTFEFRTWDADTGAELEADRGVDWYEIAKLCEGLAFIGHLG